ncbi:MAG: flavodoxin family protein [Elusimicrobia bacterium]|jgi:NAD(P)H dehydrogenase (quinone)|nr:flavodoxin family protein [Elusimicrobiota bacterium]
MTKVLIVYYSRTGNTKKMAEEVSEGAGRAGAEVELKEVKDDFSEEILEDMLNSDGIIIGSPTYYGLPSAQIKALLDRSVKHHGKLDGKVGGAFASAGNVGGGNETTILAIIEAFLIHGMVIKGTSAGDHYGPVSIGKPDSRVIKQCRALGKRVAELSEKLR